jgi:predicted P-loop ATPase
LEGLRRDRDQLWAEALHAYRRDATWWLDDAELIKEAAEEQRGRYADDVWQEKVAKYAEEAALHQEGLSGGKLNSKGQGTVAVSDILQLLGIDTAKQDQAATNRVVRCLKLAGWRRFRKRYGGPSPEWRYQKVENA